MRLLATAAGWRQLRSNEVVGNCSPQVVRVCPATPELRKLIRRSCSAEELLNSIPSPSGNACSEKINILGPNRGTERESRRQHRPIIEILARRLLAAGSNDPNVSNSTGWIISSGELAATVQPRPERRAS